MKKTFLATLLSFAFMSTALADDFQFEDGGIYTCDVKAWLKDASVPNWMNKYVVSRFDGKSLQVSYEVHLGYDADANREIKTEVFGIAAPDSGEFMTRFEIIDVAFKGKELEKRFNNGTVRFVITNCSK